MRDFIEQVKLYKEFVAIIAALVGAILFVSNYFATKEALNKSREQLNELIAVGECQLGNRITVAESVPAIAMLEREQIEKMREKFDLEELMRQGGRDRDFAREALRLERVTAELARIETEVSALRAKNKQATEYLISNACGVGRTSEARR